MGRGGAGGHFAGLDALRPINQSRDEQFSAKLVGVLLHAGVERDKSLPNLRVRKAAHVCHPDLMTLVTAGPKISKPVFLADKLCGELLLGRGMNQGRPVARGINLGGFLGSCGVVNLKLDATAA